jgi:hypothetical protein
MVAEVDMEVVLAVDTDGVDTEVLLAVDTDGVDTEVVIGVAIDTDTEVGMEAVSEEVMLEDTGTTAMV